MTGPPTFEFRFAGAGSEARPRRTEDAALRILVLGDLKGGARGGAGPDLASRPVLALDVDNFDAVMARLAPGASLLRDDPDGGQEITFAALDDFHPDALYRNLGAFEELRDLRARLLDPASFETAAAELARETVAAELSLQNGDPAARADQGGAPEDDSALFGRLLGQRAVAQEDRPAGQPPGAQFGDPAALIARLVEPEIVRGADSERQRLLVAAVDDAIARRMRQALHDPAFQALDSAWRGLWWLVGSLETGQRLEVHMLDASRAELAADLAAAGDDLGRSALYRALVDRSLGTPGARPWSLVAGLYEFGTAAQDMTLLAALGTITSRAGAPFLAAADAALLGCRSLAETPDPGDWPELDPETESRWRALRRSSVAPWIGLAAPRVLLRLPYGTRSDPIEAFGFEELAGDCGHEAFLWGSPALTCALLVGLAFQDKGWDFAPGDLLDLADLPAYTTTQDGEARLQPCAEILLGQRAAEAILDRGVMAILSHRSLNAVRLARFQSIADPPAALSGPWG